MPLLRFEAMLTDTVRQFQAGGVDANGQVPERHISDGNGVPCRHCLTGVAEGEPYRGLLGVHSRYGLHTRQVTKCDPLHQRLQPLRYLHDCSDCFRPER